MTTESDHAEAIALKDQGNAAFKQHDWPSAIDFYTKAIEKNSNEPSFYNNRAAANIKLEAFGYSIADATKSIELDPNNIKVRRGASGKGVILTRTGILETSYSEYCHPTLCRCAEGFPTRSQEEAWG